MKNSIKKILTIGLFTTISLATQMHVVAEVFTETW